MQIRNTDHSYGVVSITLHWLAALSIAVMLVSALMMANATNRDEYVPLVKFHSSVGILILLLLAARIAWHFFARQPAKLSQNPTLNRVASIVHATLLVLIGTQLVTGPVDVWSGGFPLRVFDWFTVPSLTGNVFKTEHDVIGDIHGVVGLTIGILVALHIAAVLKHAFIDRDNTLKRMIGAAGDAQSAQPQSESADPGTQMP